MARQTAKAKAEIHAAARRATRQRIATTCLCAFTFPRKLIGPGLKKAGGRELNQVAKQLLEEWIANGPSLPKTPV